MSNINATPVFKLRQGKPNDSDIKYDLIKISEPYNGVLHDFSEKTVRNLFSQYLGDLKYARLISEYNVSNSTKNGVVTYDVSYKLPSSRSASKHRITLETYNRYKQSRG